MLSREEFLEPLARRRTEEVVVTTMSVVRPWSKHSDHNLDFASADSAMAVSYTHLTLPTILLV